MMYAADLAIATPSPYVGRVGWGVEERSVEWVCKPDPVPAPPFRAVRAAIIPLAPRLPAGSSDLPGGFSRASLERPPIWSCSVWGFPCPGCHHPGGALLPHLFTLASGGRPSLRRCVFCGTFPEVTLAGR